MSTISRYGTVLTCVLALGACAPADETQETGTDTAALAPAPAPAQTAAPSDAEIGHIVKTANDGDIEGGNLAKTKGTNAEVKGYGELMINDHSALNDSTLALAQRVNLTPADNPISQQLLTAHRQAMQDLQARSGADFDRAYIAHEVDMHQNLLNSLDQTLIPNAQNAELKTLLQGGRAKVQAHLDRAKEIQAKLGN